MSKNWKLRILLQKDGIFANFPFEDLERCKYSFFKGETQLKRKRTIKIGNEGSAFFRGLYF